jgi:prolyl-tRNA editing enzyme YbaK/EbsC (Cys-tRNA(Pro) deacylase)
VTETLPEIHAILERTGYPYEVWECDPELADTSVFCKHYGVPAENSANTILVKSKTGTPKFAACVLLATHRLDVNHVVRKRLGARRVSFASAEETRDMTGMEIGGVTPLALPDGLSIWIDRDVMEREYIILGGGNRTSKLKVDPRLLELQPGVEVIEGLALPS